MDLARIRNFSIIAHIDHGKSTLSDRILELTGAVDARDMRAQYLDSMDLERERGITIKAQNVRVAWKGHTLHLIDTPGHVDFGYEVSRSLAACEGVVLVVDAAQGIEAQTLANCYLALEHDLEIVAALNKIDLPAADPDRYAEEIETVLGIPADDILRHLGQDRRGRRRAARRRDRAHPGADRRPRGAAAGADLRQPVRPVPRRRVSSVRVMNGRLSAPAAAAVHAGRRRSTRPTRSACACPVPTPVAELGPGEVGYLIAGIKDVGEARVGETVTEAGRHERTGAGRLPRPQADGVLRPLPDRRRRLRGPAREPRAAEAQRRVDHLRARDVGRARLRLPLRLPRPAAHGDRAGAAGAGVRPGPDRHRAERRVPRARTDGASRGRRQPGRPAGAPGDRVHRGALPQGLDHHAQGRTRAR